MTMTGQSRRVLKAAHTSAVAMTLVELMAAMAIVSLILASALVVIGNLSRAKLVQGERQDAASVAQPLRDVLQMDLVHATHYWKAPDGFMLASRAMLDGGTLQLAHLSGLVQYRTTMLGGSMCLVRSQEPAAGGKGLDELVCVGVKTVQLEKIGDSDSASGPAGPGPAAGTPPGNVAVRPSPRNVAVRPGATTTSAPVDPWLPMDGAIAVNILFEDAQRQPLRFVARNR